MDKDLQEYYENRFEMMSSVGWKQLMEDIDAVIKAYDDVESIDSIEKLYTRKGQLDILRWIRTLKETSETAWEEMVDAKEDV